MEEELVMGSDTIVLNSVAFTKEIVFLIPNYKEVFLFLDNDPAGNKATDFILQQYSNVTDKRDYFKTYKDLNEKLNYEK